MIPESLAKKNIRIPCLPINDPMALKLGCASCTLNLKPDGNSFPNKMCGAGFKYQHPHLPWFGAGRKK